MLITSMIKDNVDITKDAEKMKLLQEVPVLFELIRSLCYYPHSLLSPVLETMLEKSYAPFTAVEYDCDDFLSVDQDDLVFPLST